MSESTLPTGDEVGCCGIIWSQVIEGGGSTALIVERRCLNEN